MQAPDREIRHDEIEPPLPPSVQREKDASVEPAPEDKATTNLRDKMKKVDVKPSSSPTTLLARNTMLLPSGVVRLKQMSDVKIDPKPTSSAAPNNGSATGNPRNKTALAPGHSLMDWIRLGSSGVDLTGVGGVPRAVTPAELAKHDKKSDAWVAIHGIVFNVTRYMDFHPGGIEELMKGVGKDATKLFDGVHPWVNYQSILQKCVVGRLNRGASLTGGKAGPENPFRSNSSSASATRGTKSATNESRTTEHVGLVDWKQTTNAITLLFRASPDRPAAGYQLTRLDDCKLRLTIASDKDVAAYALELAGEVDWPPKWKRKLEAPEVDFIFTKRKGIAWKTYGTSTRLNEGKPDERTYRKYEIVANTQLCPVVHRIVLRATNYMELIPVGRHVEAKMDVLGMEVSRRYTPVPPCLHPEEKLPECESDCLCLMVKRYPDGALSPSITDLQPGQRLTLSSGLGTFVAENFDEYPAIHMLAAGTGLTAMLGIIQRALCRRCVTTVNLVNFNRNEDHVFYSAQLERVATDNRLKVTHVLSQPRDSWTGRRGVVSAKLLEELIGDYSPQGCVFACGPGAFLRLSKEFLLNLGWKESQLHVFDD